MLVGRGSGGNRNGWWRERNLQLVSITTAGPSEMEDEVGLCTLSKYCNPEEGMSRGLYLFEREVISARFGSEVMWVGVSMACKASLGRN